MKDLYRTKNSIYNIILNIKNLLNNIIYNRSAKPNNILTNIISDIDKENNSNSLLSSDYNKLKTMQNNKDHSYQMNMNMTLNYKTQLSTPYFKYEDELKGINIYYSNEKIQYISIDKIALIWKYI